MQSLTVAYLILRITVCYFLASWHRILKESLVQKLEKQGRMIESWLMAYVSHDVHCHRFKTHTHTLYGHVKKVKLDSLTPYFLLQKLPLAQHKNACTHICTQACTHSYQAYGCLRVTGGRVPTALALNAASHSSSSGNTGCWSRCKWTGRKAIKSCSTLLHAQTKNVNDNNSSCDYPVLIVCVHMMLQYIQDPHN